MPINIRSHLLPEEEEEEEEEETEEEEEDDEDYIPLVRSPTPLHIPSPSRPQPIPMEEEEAEEGGGEEEEEEGEYASPLPENSRNVESCTEGEEKGEVESDTSNFACPVCMEPWSSEGAHRTCCLPCGHIYGRSCIERWIRQCGKTIGRCPQCNRRCKLTEIRNIYAPRVAVVNEDLQKEVLSLRVENEFLKMQNTSLLEEVRVHKKREMDCGLHEKQKAARIEQASCVTLKARLFEHANERRNSGEHIPNENVTALQNSGGRSYASGSIALKAEIGIDGARVFDMDISSQILIICHRPSRTAGMHELTKISLLSPDEQENIPLPSSGKTIKDIRISLLSRRLSLLASMERTISIFSLETNNIVLRYNLPAPSWSCSWDFNNPNLAYAGLQNGMLTVLDLRQTRGPVECINGLSSHPVHTIYPIVNNSDHNPFSARRLLTASSAGLCQWNIGNVGERPFLIPGNENQDVCISLAHCGASNDIIASFRPKVSISNDIIASQPSVSPSPSVSGAVTRGSHVLLKRIDDNYQNRGFTHANVSAVRMQRSTIMSKEDHCPLFVSGDEATKALCVRDLTSLGVVDHLKQHSQPILDVKYAGSIDTGLLGCVSEDRVQLFTCH